MKHPNSKIVELHYKDKLAARTEQSGPSDEAVVMTGSFWDGKNVGTGLEWWEIRELLPSIINIEADDREFRTKVNEYFHELRTQVPQTVFNERGGIKHGGLKLEVGMEKDNDRGIIYQDAKGKEVRNMPLDPVDYIEYRRALRNPSVAKSFSDSNKYTQMSMFIYDRDEEVKKKLSVGDMKDKALETYMKVKKKEAAVKAICEIMAEKTLMYDDLTTGEYVNLLRKFADDKPAEFLKTANDKLLEYNYLIEVGLVKRVLIAVGGAIYYEKEQDMKLGIDKKSAALFISNEANSNILRKLKSDLEIK